MVENVRFMFRRLPTASMGLVLMAGAMAVSCASVPRTTADYPVGFREEGRASWYGDPFHGRATASGQIYDMHGLSAAHRLMPLGTVVKVTHLENGRSVEVVVNDRGPFIRGRFLDLSLGAADRLGMVESGVAPVRIEVVSLPRDSRTGRPFRYTVQVGAFSVEENARRLADRLGRRYSDVVWSSVSGSGGVLYRVRVGLFTKQAEAEQLARRLSRESDLDPFVTRKD